MTDDRVQFVDGVAYDRLMGRWSAVAGDSFLDWLALPRGLRWLDVGCGGGAFTERIVARCAPREVHGVDPSEAQLAYARARPNIGPARFVRGDAESLPYGDDRFDVATMALVISFVPDQARGVAQMKRLVVSGGTIAAYMWDVAGGGMPVEPVYAALRSLGHPVPQLGEAGREHLEGLWQRAGLEAVETTVIRVPVTFSSSEEFWELHSNSGGPTGVMIQKLSPAERERVRARIEETIPRDADGRIAYSAHANAVKGRVRG